MSRLTLQNLLIENFKGLTKYEVEMKGKDLEIIAENGIGKTTVYDAFLWLLFGKDSTGRKEFELRPLDRFNRPIKGLVLRVCAAIEFDGVSHFFRKEHKEHIVKKQLRGYETLCWIDEVPKKVTEYQKYITDMVSEEHFKLLTDLTFFADKMHWTERRTVLLEIAGEVGEPEGFEDLLSKAGCHTTAAAQLVNKKINDLKTVLTEQKKRHVKERDEINPRLDEILKGLEQPTIGALDDAALTEKRSQTRENITAVKNTRQTLLASEKERQEKIDRINELETQKRVREIDLMKPDPTKTAALKTEKAQLQSELAKTEENVRQDESIMRMGMTAKESAENSLRLHQGSLSDIRTAFTEADGKKESTVCYACGQKLPEGMIKKVEDEHQLRLNELARQGTELKLKCDADKQKIAKLTESIAQLRKVFEKSKTDLEQERVTVQERFEQLDKQIADCPISPPEEDQEWKNIVAEIIKVKHEIGAPAIEQLEAIENKLMYLERDMEEVNKSLAQTDRIIKDRARVKELEQLEKDLAQKLADIESDLEDIGRYKAAQSKLITDCVNKKFECAEFKMFNVLLNGSIEECCEVTFGGIPNSDMSNGEKMFVRLDIINVLSEHYGASVPLFIDHAESMTMPIDAHSQTIELKAKESYTEQVVTAEGIKEVFHDYSKLQFQVKTEAEKAVA